MIGADTNILVRACLEDSPEEARLAKQFLNETSHSKKLFISSYALLEFIWVLKVKDVSRLQIIEAVLTLLDSPGIIIGQREIVILALEHYRRGKADFGDYMILAEGEVYSTHHLATFDKALYKENNRCHHPADWLEKA